MIIDFGKGLQSLTHCLGYIAILVHHVTELCVRPWIFMFSIHINLYLTV